MLRILAYCVIFLGLTSCHKSSNDSDPAQPPATSPTPTPTDSSTPALTLELEPNDNPLLAPELPSVSLTGGTKIHGINFGPFVREGSAPGATDLSESELTNLLTNLAPYTEWVRTYGTNNGQDKIGEIAHSLGLSVAMGAWLDADLPTNTTQINDVIALAKAGHADMVIIGSEVLLAGSLSESDLVAYIDQAKAALPDWDIACAEEIGAMMNALLWQDACDIWLVNIYPFWQGVNINQSVRSMHKQYADLLAMADGKPVIISETGWPSGTSDRVGMGDALPTPENAAYYFLNFISWAEANDVDYFYFEAFDEPWKEELGFGSHWGVWDRFLNLKPGMELVFNGFSHSDNWSD